MRAAILARLNADADLATLMGGAVRLHDEPPRAARGVYAVFSDVTARDWSTGSSRGEDQTLGLVVWAEEGSAATGFAAVERIAALLQEADLALAGHRLVTLRMTETQAARDRATGRVRVTLRLRALIETD